MRRFPVLPGTSPANRRALVWNIAMGALLFAAAVGKPGMAILGIIGGGLVFGTLGWGLFHLREIFRARDTLFRWAFVGTFAVFLVGLAASQTQLAQSRYADIVLLSIVFSTPLVFGATLAWGALGAALGVSGAMRGAARRGEAFAPESAIVGASLMWIFTIIGLLLTVYESNVILVGTPLWVFYLCRGAWVGRLPVTGATSRGMRVLDRLLVRRSARRTIDFRGAVFGLLAGVIALSLGFLLTPLRQASYMAMTQIAFRIKSTGGSGNNQGPPLPVTFVVASPALAQTMVVDWDADALREVMMPPGSEASVQARLVETLARAGAKRILLVHPITKVSSGALGHLTVPGVPLPTSDDTDRTVRDLPRLADAIKKAGNVVVLYDADTVGDARVRMAAQYSVFVDEFLAKAFEPISSDALLMRLARDKKQAAKSGDDDVFAAFDFLPLHVSARTVLSGAPVYLATSDSFGRGAKSPWLPPARAFKGKTLVIGSSVPVLTRTPRGEMLASESLAQVVEAQQANRLITRPGPLVLSLLTLGCGLLGGLASARRAPLDGLWRILIWGFVIASTSLFLLLLGRYVDPVGPLCAVIIAYLFVTQLTHSIGLEQRDANRRMLARFLSPEAADLLLGTTDNPYKELGLGGARRRVCVLFADIRSFTPFAEQHTPEQVVDAVNSYMGAMTDALYSHGGILDKYTGDGLMAFFIIGEGEAGQRDVARAVHAARAMAQAALQVAALSDEPLRVGIGMHYGEAVVGLVGSAARPDYTAMGHTVVVSARLQTIAEGGQVIISQAVREIVGDGFAVEEGEPVRVKGLTDMVRPYRLLEE